MVGSKTTNVVLSELYGIPNIAVDTHVERVSKRLKLVKQKNNVLEVENTLKRKIPKDKWIKFPEYNPPKEVDYSFLLNIYQNKVNNALQGTPEQIKSTINEIKMLRKISLMNDGEYSKGNLVFKELRNNGSIDNLYNKLHELTSKELSLEKIKF